jgi:hypothetical protein
MKRLLTLIATLIVLGLATLAAQASAETLTVTIPCGCNFSLQVGAGVSGTPAEHNPSGTVGNADQPQAPGPFGEGLIYPSGSARFTP